MSDFTNGFPNEIRELPTKKRLTETFVWWLAVHVGNTGFTKNNHNRLKRELADIFNDNQDNKNLIVCADYFMYKWNGFMSAHKEIKEEFEKLYENAKLDEKKQTLV